MIQTRKSVIGRKVKPEFIKLRKKFLVNTAILARLNRLGRKQHISQNVLLKRAILDALEQYSANNLFIHARIQLDQEFLKVLSSTLGGE